MAEKHEKAPGSKTPNLDIELDIMGDLFFVDPEPGMSREEYKKMASGKMRSMVKKWEEEEREGASASA